MDLVVYMQWWYCVEFDDVQSNPRMRFVCCRETWEIQDEAILRLMEALKSEKEAHGYCAN